MSADVLAQPMSPGLARILPGLVRVREAVVISELPEGLDGLVDKQAHHEDQHRAILLAKARANPKKFVDFYDLAKAEGWAKISRERLEDDLCESLSRAFFAAENTGALFKRGATDEANLSRLKDFLVRQLPSVLRAEPYDGYEVALLTRQRIGGYDESRRLFPFLSNISRGWMPLTLASGKDPSIDVQMQYAPMPAPEGVPANSLSEIEKIRSLPSRDVYVALVLRVVGYDAANAFADTLLVEPVSAMVFPLTSLGTPIHTFEPVDFRLDEVDLAAGDAGEDAGGEDLTPVGQVDEDGSGENDPASATPQDNGQDSGSENVAKLSEDEMPQAATDQRDSGAVANGDSQQGEPRFSDSGPGASNQEQQGEQAAETRKRTPEEIRTMALRTIIVLGALCVIVLTYRVVNR
ncbi:MAG: hypothetical protein KDA37_17810 [Planctomycetales bacterium]|nr:hypothetical protein [Planctomycetales bacterium]